MDFVAIDIETACSQPWSICQIGIAIVENGELIKTLSYMVQPPDNSYQFWNSRVHGIIPFMTRNSPFFPEVWQQIHPHLHGRKLVAHNAVFDIDCLRKALEYYQLDVPVFDYQCTYRMTGLGLDRACAGFDIPLEKHHDAGCDAEACARIYLKLLSGELPRSDLKKVSRKAKLSFEGHNRLNKELLKPLESVDNPDNPFCRKRIVFTGVLENISRLDAAKLVRNMGGHICQSVSTRTQIVIVGCDPGPVKMEKIFNYNEQGGNIRIIKEKEFLELLKN